MTASILQQKEKFFDRWAPNYDWLLPTVFYQAVHKRLLDYVTLPPQAQVLDLGCGTGRLLDRLAQAFPDFEAIGYDLSPVMIAQAQARNPPYRERLQFQVGEASQLPFEDNRFDAVFNTYSFLHYPEPQQVLRQVHRVLKPGGQFHWVDPTVGDWPSRLYSRFYSPTGIYFYSRRQRQELGAAVGLDWVRHADLLGPTLLSQFIKPKR
jgi:ubiquinone/menaquinone biosynthesis C-methylase UbiE